MQDRAYVIAIVVVLAICCLGGVVAVTGYINSNPGSVAPFTGTLAITPVVIAVNTDTPIPAVTKSSAPASSALTPVAVPSPLGAFQTIAASSANPSATPAIASSVAKVLASPTTGATAISQVSCAGFAFCPQGGPADASLGPGGVECPRNYVWGRVVDVNGRGLANMRVRYQGPSGEYEIVLTKSPPDPAGLYNILAPPGSTWTIWLIDANGNDSSPHVNVVTQIFSGTGNCPSRRDFIQQK